MRILTIATMAVALGGCLNVALHCTGKAGRAYSGTVVGIELFREYPPVRVPLVLDLPLEVAADTVTLPYDILMGD